jgi:lipid-binding SYLF domain-containing protein
MMTVDRSMGEGRPFSFFALVVLFAMLLMTITACAGGLVGSTEKKLAYFESLEKETLAQLVKEQPGTEQELAQSVGYAVFEKKVVKVPVVGAGGGAGVVVEKANGKKTYLRVPELQLGLGWGGRAEKVILIFQDLEKLRDLAGGKWKAGIAAEAAAKAGDVGAAGGGSTGDLMKKGFTIYVLTDAGVSATATIVVLRAQPYSID